VRYLASSWASPLTIGRAPDDVSKLLSMLTYSSPLPWEASRLSKGTVYLYEFFQFDTQEGVSESTRISAVGLRRGELDTMGGSEGVLPGILGSLYLGSLTGPH
jgi:hypothetical protein